MNFFRKYWRKFSLIVFFAIMPAVSFAQGSTTCDPSKGMICNPISSNTIQQFIEIILKGVLRLGIPLVALAIIYCGFLFVAARGNTEKLTKAKDALLYTLIGTAILLGSYAIATLISETVLAL